MTDKHTYKEILDQHPGMSYNDIIRRERDEKRRKAILENPNVILTLPDPTDDEIIYALDLKPELVEQFGELPEPVQLVYAMRNNWTVKKKPITDEQKLRSRYGSLEKIFKDPYDAKFVKWFAVIGVLFGLNEVVTVVLEILQDQRPLDQLMSAGEIYTRAWGITIGICSYVFLRRVRKNRRKYGTDTKVLDRELSEYGDPVDLRGKINKELASEEAVVMMDCVVTKNWLITVAYLGYPAKIVPLDKIRYIGKFENGRSARLVFFDEKINELAMVNMKENLLEELAARLQKKVPQIEFYGYYLIAYNEKAAKFNIEDAKKDGQLRKHRAEVGHQWSRRDF